MQVDPGPPERVLRGIPRWLLREYLEDLGGRVRPAADGGPAGAGLPVPDPASAGPADGSPEEDIVDGDGWTATLTQLEDFRIGSLSSGQVRLVVTGEPDRVRGLLARLAPRLFRGGG